MQDKEQESEVQERPKPRKPPGAVSLFGGVDMFGGKGAASPPKPSALPKPSVEKKGNSFVCLSPNKFVLCCKNR